MRKHISRIRALQLLLALLAGTASAGSFELLAPDVEAGGGPMVGGVFSAYSTLGSEGAATVLRGGDYELTPGLQRRRETAILPQLFASGFE